MTERPTVSELRKAAQDGCILWQGPLMGNGYGRIGKRPAHRVFYEQSKGLVLSLAIDLHHLCGQKSCVNIEHLAPLTKREHGRLHTTDRGKCRRGHEWSNSGVVAAAGRKRCSLCLLKEAAWRKANKHRLYVKNIVRERKRSRRKNMIAYWRDPEKERQRVRERYWRAKHAVS